MALEDILNGKIPEVPFKVTIDDKSIMKLSIAAVMVVTICMMIGFLLSKK